MTLWPPSVPSVSSVKKPVSSVFPVSRKKNSGFSVSSVKKNRGFSVSSVKKTVSSASPVSRKKTEVSASPVSKNQCLQRPQCQKKKQRFQRPQCQKKTEVSASPVSKNNRGFSVPSVKKKPVGPAHFVSKIFINQMYFDTFIPYFP
jgi:ribosomal protein L13E